MINKRLPDLSCNEEEYGKANPLYETALNESGYKTTMTYTKTTTANNRNRARNIIWSNPHWKNISQVSKKTFSKRS